MTRVGVTMRAGGDNKGSNDEGGRDDDGVAMTRAGDDDEGGLWV